MNSEGYYIVQTGSFADRAGSPAYQIFVHDSNHLATWVPVLKPAETRTNDPVTLQRARERVKEWLGGGPDQAA